MGLKIKLHTVNGVDTVNPEVMELLISLSEHSQFCEPCEAIKAGRGGVPCNIGREILRKLGEHPDVSEYKD